MPESRRNNLILALFLITKVVAQYFLVDPSYQLQRDEYLHLDQANHLSFGYLSVPPFTSWISLIIKWLGNSLFWIRFFPAIFGAFTIYFVWRTVEKLNGGLFACILAASGLLFSVLLRLNILFQPNAADVLFWTMVAFYLISYFQSNKNRFLYFAAISFAFGMLNKYNIAFWAAGLIAGILISRQRTVFANKHLYFAGLVALVIFLPNLLWQASHKFPIVGHMQELKRTQLVNVKTSDFLSDQLLFFMGSFFIWMAAFPALVFYQPLKKFRFIGWAFLTTMLLFIFLHAKSYYAIGIYPIFFAFGSVYIEKLTESKRARVIRYALPVVPLIILIPMFNIIFPLLSPKEIIARHAKFEKFGLLRWEDGKNHAIPQDFADMLGWKQMAALADSAYALIPENERQYTVVFCNNYGQAGAINYYSRFKNIGAVSFNADYLTWFPWDRKIKHAIRVKDDEPDEDPDDTQEKSLFESYQLIGRVSDSSAREFNTKIILLMNAKADINKILEEELKEE